MSTTTCINKSMFRVIHHKPIKRSSNPEINWTRIINKSFEQENKSESSSDDYLKALIQVMEMITSYLSVFSPNAGKCGPE